VRPTFVHPRRSSASTLVLVPPSGGWRRRRIRERLPFRAAVTLALAVIVVGAAIAARDATRRLTPPRGCETAIVSAGAVAGTLRLPGRLAVESSVRVGTAQPGMVVAVTVFGATP